MLDPEPACLALGIPEYLHQRGRSVDNEFLPEERLFRRIPPTIEIADGVDVPLAIFTTRRMSVNRAKYSQRPEDVLYNITSAQHYGSSGIAEFQVQVLDQLRIRHPTQANIEFTLKITHKPDLCMYPHAEVEVYENGVKIDDIKPSSVKTQIKARLAESCHVRKLPTKV